MHVASPTASPNEQALQLVPGGLANAPYLGHIWAICLQIFVFYMGSHDIFW